MYFKLAFRNIWRNKGRSLITIASIFFAVLFSSFMNSFQKGAWNRMQDNVVNFYYGYIQIHDAGYWDDRSINKAFVNDDKFDALKLQIPKISEVIPRLESFALVSHSTQTGGMLVVGTDPDRENILTNLKDKLTAGQYFSANDKAVIIAEDAAKTLNVSIGDTVVMISQGYHGVNAAAKYPVKGIVKFASPDLNKRMIYLPLKESQSFFGADNMITSIALKLNNKNDIADVKESLEATLSKKDYEIMDWKKMLPELVEAEKSDAAGNYIFILVLYVLITFGIFGTILMMVKEREYEFGVLISIGMKRRLLAFVSWMEIVILGLIGALFGILGSLPLAYYFYLNPLDFGKLDENMSKTYEKWGFDPVIPTSLEPDIFLNQAIVVFVLTSILAGYAVYKINRLKPIEAMRD